MQAKVHDLIKYRVLTYTYSILSRFKETFWIPSFLHDQYAREVVVCCIGAVSYLACLLASMLVCCLIAWLVGWLFGWLVGWLVGWLIG